MIVLQCIFWGICFTITIGFTIGFIITAFVYDYDSDENLDKRRKEAFRHLYRDKQ